MIYILLPTIEEHYKNRMLSQFSSKYLSKTLKKSVFTWLCYLNVKQRIHTKILIFVTLAVLTSMESKPSEKLNNFQIKSSHILDEFRTDLKIEQIYFIDKASSRTCHCQDSNLFRIIQRQSNDITNLTISSLLTVPKKESYITRSLSKFGIQFALNWNRQSNKKRVNIGLGNEIGITDIFRGSVC